MRPAITRIEKPAMRRIGDVATDEVFTVAADTPTLDAPVPVVGAPFYIVPTAEQARAVPLSARPKGQRCMVQSRADRRWYLSTPIAEPEAMP